MPNCSLNNHMLLRLRDIQITMSSVLITGLKITDDLFFEGFILVLQNSFLWGNNNGLFTLPVRIFCFRFLFNEL